MAGFLNKKSRLIDYKLTENGRKQMSLGDIRFKYFTFSDRSINYESKIEDNNIISDSEFYYLPFEVSTDPGIYINPEYFLSSELSFDNSQSNFFNLQTTQKTLINHLISKNIISNKKITNSNVSLTSQIVFESVFKQDVFDFYNQNFIRRYPTIKYVEEKIENVKPVREDTRFIDHIRHKKLSPLNSNNDLLSNEVVESNNDNLFIFKTLDIHNTISLSDDKDNVVSKSIKALKDNPEKIYSFNYNFDSSYSSNQDIFTFEIHSIENNDLKKLPVVNLGNIYDKSNNKYYNVYLIGKFIKNDKIEDFVNIENKVYKSEKITEFKFVNLFTLVVE